MAFGAHRKEILSAGVIGACVLVLTFFVIRYPDQTFQASFEGLQLWLRTVLPALFPFFVISEILMGIGVIHALGVMLEPIMRPLFRVPGVGAFALVMGLVSGNPLGAKITGQLRRDDLCTREEGERLVAFANTAGPLFMIGAVAVGMFHDASLGLLIVVSHYLAVLLVGLCFRFHGGKSEKTGRRSRTGLRGGLIRRAMQAMATAHRQDGRPFGRLLSDAIRESMAAMIFIGGTIMMFSVLIRILSISGALQYAAAALGAFITLFGVDAELIAPLTHGIVEMTNGAQSISQASSELVQRLMAIGFILGWSGLSVHTQVAAMLYGTDIRFAPYFMARCLHGMVAAALTWLLFPVLRASENTTVPAIATVIEQLSYWGQLGVMFGMIAGAVGLLLLLSFVMIVIRRIHIVRF